MYITKLFIVYYTKLFKTALFQMYPTKAPGPNGFPAHFFQRHWDLCGEEVTHAVLNILNGVKEIGEVNKTLLLLIPKVLGAFSLYQFRPCAMLFSKLCLKCKLTD